MQCTHTKLIFTGKSLYHASGKILLRHHEVKPVENKTHLDVEKAPVFTNRTLFTVMFSFGGRWWGWFAVATQYTINVVPF